MELKSQETLLDNGQTFVGVPLDQSFNIFEVHGQGVTKKDAVIAFKYLEKLTEHPNPSKLVKDRKNY